MPLWSRRRRGLGRLLQAPGFAHDGIVYEVPPRVVWPPATCPRQRINWVPREGLLVALDVAGALEVGFAGCDGGVEARVVLPAAGMSPAQQGVRKLDEIPAPTDLILLGVGSDRPARRGAIRTASAAALRPGWPVGLLELGRAPGALAEPDLGGLPRGGHPRR